MADNVSITPGVGANIAADEILGVKYPRSKMVLGADGNNDGDVSASNPVPMTIATNNGGGLFDAFGRLRVSNPRSLFTSKLLYDKAPLLWDEVVNDSSGFAASTHVPADACVTMSVQNGDTITRQTKRRLNYQPGKSQFIFLTTVLGNNVAGVTKRVGYFDENNGLFFEQDATDLKVVVRKGASDTAVTQTNWNIDTFDGNGPSGITLNEANAQIFFIDFEWLGVGRIRFGIVVDGKLYYCHEVLNSNNITSVYMSTPNLPLRYEISSTSGTATLTQICSSVISEGGNPDEYIGLTRSVSNGTSHIDANSAGTSYALVGLRLKSTHLGADVLPTSLDVISLTNDNFRWALCLNPTLASPVPFLGITDSCIERGLGSTVNTVSDLGTVLAQGYIYQTGSSTNVIQSSLRLGSTISGTRDELYLVATPFTSNADICGSITWRELQ